MLTPQIYDVTYRCGHSEKRGYHGSPINKERFIAVLENQLCKDCCRELIKQNEIKLETLLGDLNGNE